MSATKSTSVSVFLPSRPEQSSRDSGLKPRAFEQAKRTSAGNSIVLLNEDQTKYHENQTKYRRHCAGFYSGCSVLRDSEQGAGNPPLSTHAVRLHGGTDDAGLDLQETCRAEAAG